MSPVINGDSETYTLHWCFVGADNHSVCCSCDGHCSEENWTLNVSTNQCNCDYRCSFTVSSVSMKYNNGTIYSYVYYGPKRTLTITHISVISGQSFHRHKTHIIYYIIGSGSGAVVIIFLVIAVVCNVKEYRRRQSLQVYQRISGYVEQDSFRKSTIIML